MRVVLALFLLMLPGFAQAAPEPEAVAPGIMSFPSPEAPRGEMARPPSEPPPPEARPETVVAGLSSDEVAITTNFDGSLITIYGAIKRETPVPTDNKLQVVVTIEGPARSVTIRRKARRFGIWVNTESVVVGSAPSFYAVASTAPLQYILRADEDSRYRITVPTVMRAFARPFDVEDPVEFTEAMIDMRMADGTYLVEPRGVKLEQETLLRADFHLPANLVEGVYRTRIFLLRDGRVVDTYTAPIDVEKVGLERWLYRMAFDQPFLYGLMSLFIAAFAGWGANAGFRILQRK